MPTAVDSLLLKFRSKDGRFGVTRKTVKALASQLARSEPTVGGHQARRVRWSQPSALPPLVTADRPRP